MLAKATVLLLFYAKKRLEERIHAKILIIDCEKT
jgi:hypothetical protein